MKEWLASARLPTLSEISTESYAGVMRTTGTPPLVGVIVLSRAKMGSRFDEHKDRALALASGWAERRRGLLTGERGRDVVWAWVDGDKWASWIQTMYDVKPAEEPVLVFADTVGLRFWKTALDGSPLALGDRNAAYSFVEQGIYTGVAVAETSRNLIERWGLAVADGASWLLTHPVQSLLGLVASWIVLLGAYRAYMRRTARSGSYQGHQRYDYAKVD